MTLIEDEGVAISIAIIIFGIALGLPNINLGIFGVDFSAFPTLVITTMRIGLIGLALSIGLKSIESDSNKP